VSEIEGPVSRVVVIGAGIAGLAAASRLRRAGIECVVLEARDRMGGRLYTIDLAGTPVDLGGSWIHHPIGNPLSAFCDDYDIARDRGDPLPSLSAYDRAERRRLDHAETEIYSRTESNGFWDAVGQLSERLGPDATGLDAIESYVSEREFVDGAARRLRQELLTEVEANAADRADNESLRWLVTDEDYDGELFGDLPRDGYGSVVRALATGLDIRFDTEVTSVEIDGRGVRLTCADGSTEIGSHVIVTVPLGVLKRGGLRFDPPLPAPVQRAVDALGFGRYEKIALRFESAFWRDFDLSHLIVFPSAPAEPAMWVFDLDDFGAGPVLCAHLFHTITPYAIDRPAAEAVDWLKDVLAEVCGRPVPEPVATAVTSWAHDPFTGGAYTHCPPGADPAMLDLLAEPVHGRLLLAGEHTHRSRVGYADGAYSSGLRAAERLGAQSNAAICSQDGQTSYAGSLPQADSSTLVEPRCGPRDDDRDQKGAKQDPKVDRNTQREGAQDTKHHDAQREIDLQ
jgi:polyamine oxidase